MVSEILSGGLWSQNYFLIVLTHYLPFCYVDICIDGATAATVGKTISTLAWIKMVEPNCTSWEQDWPYKNNCNIIFT